MSAATGAVGDTVGFPARISINAGNLAPAGSRVRIYFSHAVGVNTSAPAVPRPSKNLPTSAAVLSSTPESSAIPRAVPPTGSPNPPLAMPYIGEYR